MSRSSYRSLYPIALTSASLALVSCMSLGRSSFRSDRGPCVPRPDLAGVWHSRRPSQLGASTVTLRLECNCRYRMTVSLPFGRATEEGEYRIEDDRLVFSRKDGETYWPFRSAGNTVVITESGTEAYEYVRTQPANCGTARNGETTVSRTKYGP